MKNFCSLLLLAAACFVLPSTALCQYGGNNPTGVTGSYNGSVTSAGSYDPYTGNATRVIEDLSVTGAVGAYPLKLTRTMNSRSLAGMFGAGGGWRHSYQWGLSVATGGCNGESCYEGPMYTVSLPDGRVFHPDQYYGNEAPPGQLSQNADGSYSFVLPDGGVVRFDYPPYSYGNSYRATSITDPFGLVTSLTYDNVGRLTRVTEPAGRYLVFTYDRYSWQWVMSGFTYSSYTDVITKVQAFPWAGAPASEEVSYGYQLENINAAQRYYYLTDVSYAGGAHATYTYSPYVPGGTGYSALAGHLKTCDDVRYAGPMKHIEYEYQATSAVEHGYGQISKEKNSLGQAVSQVTYPPPSPQYEDGHRFETRGDGYTRSFVYDTIKGELQSYSDFQNQL